MVIKTASLTEQTLRVIRDKGTESPFSGQYDDFGRPGTYLCRQCGIALFRAKSKFHSGCGWPSFDEEIPDTVKRKLDADGTRIEILCARCDAHLGHVFLGEGFTPLNTRHCVNSLSLEHVDDDTVMDTEEAIVAGGCFWGVEFLFQELKGVLKTEVGYSGGHLKNPTYREVCSGTSGHYEAIRILYDPSKISFYEVMKFFFEIHDFTQSDGQGPDRGQQYLSVAFYFNAEQQKIIQDLLGDLTRLGYHPATKVLPVTVFWPAEEYHQNYYSKNKHTPYCHRYEKKFIE